MNQYLNYVQADIVGSPNVANPSDVDWFNSSAFTLPQQPFRNGDAARDSLRGPAEYLFNLALGKDFTLGEGKTLEFRWENFNAFNHVNLGLPASTVDQAGAGQIFYAQTPPRQMQFGLHLHF